MGLQRAFDLERRDVEPRNLQHVVVTPAINVIAVLVLEIFVAGARPFAHEGAPRLRAVVPVHDRARRPADEQFAHLALLHRLAVVVDQLDLVAGTGFAGGAVFHVARPVGQEDVQHLGRADAVENVALVFFPEAPADFLRQRLAGGDAAAEFHLARLRRVRAREERRIESRHAVEHRDRMFLQQGRDAVRRRPLVHQHRRGADRHRKCHGVAEAIGEEQLRDRIAEIVFGDAEDGRGIKIVGQLQARLRHAPCLSACRSSPTNKARTPCRRAWSARCNRRASRSRSRLRISRDRRAVPPETITVSRSGQRLHDRLRISDSSACDTSSILARLSVSMNS